MSRPIIAATALTAVLFLGACGNKNATEEDVQEVLVDAGASKTQADCAASKIKEKLTQDELNDLASADHKKDIPPKVSAKIDPILDECLTEGGGTDESTTSTTAGETSESTESTTSTTAG